jgi:hypothetical protein
MRTSDCSTWSLRHKVDFNPESEFFWGSPQGLSGGQAFREDVFKAHSRHGLEGIA